METKTVAAAYLLKSREAMLHKIVSRSVAAGGSLLFSIVQIEYERYNAGNRAESAEPLKIDDSKFSPDQCVFDEDGIYWSFIRFEGDTAVIHGCGELYRFARPAIDDPDQTEWIAFEKY